MICMKYEIKLLQLFYLKIMRAQEHVILMPSNMPSSITADCIAKFNKRNFTFEQMIMQSWTIKV